MAIKTLYRVEVVYKTRALYDSICMGDHQLNAAVLKAARGAVDSGTDFYDDPPTEYAVFESEDAANACEAELTELIGGTNNE